MKKKLPMALVAMFVLLLQGNTLPTKVQPSFSAAQVTADKPALLTYTWFEDEEMTIPTGTISEINVEVERLQDLYTGYVFTSSPGMGLYNFEYGYYPGYETAIIFSNFYQ
jgi:hypothetical protein